MPIITPRTMADLDKGTLVNLMPRPDSTIELPLFNRAPNQYFTEVNRDGLPFAWDCPYPTPLVGHYPYVSRPGNSAENASPPKRGTLSRQEDRPLKHGQDYVGNKRWIGGFAPIFNRIHANPGLDKPARPEVRAIGTDLTGFRVVGGANTTYRLAYGLRDGKGGRTKVSASTTITFAPGDAGKGIRFIVPPETGDSPRLDIYQGAPNGDDTTLRLQRTIPLPDADGFVNLQGPWNDSGEAPATEDSTVLTPPTPDIRGENADIYLGPGAYGVRAGRYNFYYQYANERGPSMLSGASEMVEVIGQVDRVTKTENHTYHADETSDKFTVNDNPFTDGDKVFLRAPAVEPFVGGRDYYVRDHVANSFKLAESPGGAAINVAANGSGTIYGDVTRDVQRDYVERTAFHVRTPRNIPRGVRWTVWLFKVPTGGGQGVYYRLYRKRSSENTTDLYSRNDRGGERRATFQIYGFSPENEPIALRNGLTEDSPPTEDTTGLPFDVSAIPDDPEIIVLNTAAAPATYLFAVSGAGDPSADIREESVVSETIKKRIEAGETYRVTPKPTTNALPNAEFRQVKRNNDGPQGKEIPVDWTFTDGTPAAAAGERRWFSSDGVAVLTTDVALTAGHMVESEAWKVPANVTVFSVAGRLGCTEHLSGTTNLIVRQMSATGTLLRATTILTITSDDPVQTPPGGVTFGPGGDYPFEAGVDSVVLRLKASDGGWRQRVTLRDAGIFPFAEALRKVVPGEPGEPANVDPNPARPFAPSSFAAIGQGTPHDRPNKPDAPSFAWEARTDYEVGNRRLASAGNVGYGDIYEVTRAGKSVGTEPRFTPTLNVNTRDVNGLTPIERDTDYVLGAARLRPAGTTEDNNWWRCTTAGRTALTNPGYPEPATIGTTVTDGTAVFTAEQIVIWNNVGTQHRKFDPLGGPIHQMYLFIQKGIRPSDAYGPRLRYQNTGEVRPIVVRPGFTYTFAVYARQTVFDATDAPKPFHLSLHGFGKGPISLGNPFGELGAATGEWMERVWSFKVPERAGPDDPGYTELHIDSRDMAPGVYVFQEPLFAEGNLLSWADRDAKRGYGRPTSGSFRTTFSQRLAEGYAEEEIGPIFDTRWATFGAKTSGLNLPVGNSATFTFRSGPTPQGPWSPETSNKALVPENECLQVAGTLTGDGTNTPRILPGHIWLETRHPGVAVLTDEDRQSLPGVALVGYSPTAYTRAGYEVITLDNHPFAVPIPDTVTKLPPFRVLVTNEEALQYLLALSPNDEVHVEAPFAGGTGLVYRGRFYDVIEPPEEGLFGGVQAWEGRKKLVAYVETPEMEVLEAAPMAPLRG